MRTVVFRQLRHDLRTPVNHIVGYAELVQEELDDFGATETVRSLAVLVSDARRLTELIDQVIQPERFSPSQKAFAEDGTLADRVVAVQHSIARIGDQVLKLGHHEQLKDIRRMSSAADGLVERISVGLKLPQTSLNLNEAETMPLIFDADTAVIAGGGRKLADSEGKYHILVVDDNEDNRNVLTRILKRDGYAVSEAVNGQEAYDRIQEVAFDLLILDIMMPVMDGMELLSLIRAKHEFSTLPVIMLTSMNEVESAVTCIREGADDYLTKPLNPVLLGSRIEMLVERRRLREQVEELGRYTLDEKIGEGGMAEVYRAQHALLKRPTAIKLLRSNGPGMIAGFEREVQQTSQLSHPNTVAIYDYGVTPEGRFYYAMEYLDGITLDELVDRYGPLCEARAIHILRQICGSLNEAHGRGLIHRDIKPGNIILCERGGVCDVAKLCDFGLVTDLNEEQPDSNMLAGTPLFMAPEAFKRPVEVGYKSDIYALGVLAYYLVCGRPPFIGVGLSDIMKAHSLRVPSPPSRFAPGAISAALEAIILNMLEKEPDARPACVKDVESVLNALSVEYSWSVEDADNWWQSYKVRH